jgi:adenylate cyclase class IV
MKAIEVETKSLLSSAREAEELLRKMRQLDAQSRLLSQEKQLNHYFCGNQIGPFVELLRALGKAEEAASLEAAKLKDFSLRTRSVNGASTLVVKATLDGTTSANGTARLEFNIPLPGKSLEEVDQMLLDKGYAYQAKWSRARQEYACFGVHICVDKNAGYGYLVEIEKMVEDPSLVDAAKAEVRKMMAELALKELDPARLERMFAYYNAHWPEYYGTEKTFIVD